MGKFYDHITPHHQAFIARQHIFFVSSAPLSGEGHVNLSPKGLDSFRVLSPNRVAYMDLISSGNETSAHLLENGRITLMFCAFDQPPLILRIYGRGRIVLADDPEWDVHVVRFDPLPGARQIFVIDVGSVQTSCGWGVPMMTFERPRETLIQYHARQDPVQRLEKIKDRTKSIDGLPVRPPTRVARFPDSAE